MILITTTGLYAAAGSAILMYIRVHITEVPHANKALQAPVGKEKM